MRQQFDRIGKINAQEERVGIGARRHRLRHARAVTEGVGVHQGGGGDVREGIAYGIETLGAYFKAGEQRVVKAEGLEARQQIELVINHTLVGVAPWMSWGNDNL